jgi:hypothetical protein
MRILLCEEIINKCENKVDSASLLISTRARSSIEAMIKAICASAPPMIDCTFAGRHKLPTTNARPYHSHTLSHYLDAYILIYGLYVAEHFGIKQAAIVAGILRKGWGRGRCIGCWGVMLLLLDGKGIEEEDLNSNSAT